MTSSRPEHPRDLRAVDLVARKRDGRRISAEEVAWLIGRYVGGAVGEELMAAFLMAAYIRGMDFEETAALTLAMAASGRPVDLTRIPGVKVDKHSTGGVGDKTTLVVAPLVAAAGVPVAKMSGRSLGHTGGTIDKLESIPGLSCDMTPQQLVLQVRRIGVAIAAQSPDLCPADKRMYALRDRIGAVASIPLIASSVMAKKLVIGGDAIVLDVKCGSGAFMKDLRSARRLAMTMIEIGARASRPTAALISDMSQPLGWAVGEALEVGEAIEVLRGGGPLDVRELSLELGARMLLLAHVARNGADARRLLGAALSSGQALAKLRQMIEAQGGDVGVAPGVKGQDPGVLANVLPRAPRKWPVRSPQSGYVRAIDAQAVGEIARELVRQGGPGAGIVLLKKRGHRVAAGDPLAVLHLGGNGGRGAASRARALLDGYTIGDRPPPRRALILERLVPASATPR